MNSNNDSSSGMTFLGVLQIIFIVLKLVGVINWSWVMVFIPAFIDLGLSAILLIIYVCILARYK